MYVQRHGSIHGEKEGCEKRTSMRRPENGREIRVNPPFADAAASFRANGISWWSSSSSANNRCDRDIIRLHRSHSPMTGRPPRHPDHRKASRTFSSGARSPPPPGRRVRRNDVLDSFRNERYPPADLLARFEGGNNGVLPDEREARDDVPSLLASEEWDDDTALSESEARDEGIEHIPCIFQFWDIWGQGNCGQRLACGPRLACWS